jgi:hypothetical protein
MMPPSASFFALLDRIIPVDEWPSATTSGVDRFILALWQSGADGSAGSTAAGLDELDKLAGHAGYASFADAPEITQDTLLEEVAAAVWFRQLCELAAEGYYANPGNGANPDAISWHMIGYKHGLPEGPDGPPADRSEARMGKLWA